MTWRLVSFLYRAMFYFMSMCFLLLLLILLILNHQLWWIHVSSDDEWCLDVAHDVPRGCGVLAGAMPPDLSASSSEGAAGPVDGHLAGAGEVASTQPMSPSVEVPCEPSPCVSNEQRGSGVNEPRGSGESEEQVSGGIDANGDLGKGMRTKFPSAKLHDFVTNTIRNKGPSFSSSAPPSSPSKVFSITHFVGSNRFSSTHRNYVAAITEGNEPKSFTEAMKHEGWRKAMADEIQALEEQGTWVLEDLPPGKKALGSKWVYKEKYDEHGNLQRLKARLVVFGHHQVEGLDFNETFAPVAKMVTVRTFLAVAAVKNWEVHQTDVHNAFLHGDLEEEVYMKIPLGFDNHNTNQV